MMSGTRLSRELAGGSDVRAAPRDAFRLARRCILSGERLDMSRLAEELGISRVTLYRWVGSRDQLLVEVIWSLARDTLEGAARRTARSGGARVTAILAGFLQDTMAHDGWQGLLAREGDRVLTLCTTSEGGFQSRFVAAVRDILQEEVDAGRLDVPVATDELAYALVRLIESYVYRRLITGDDADVRAAGQLIGMLLR